MAEALPHGEERTPERPSPRGFLAYGSAHCQSSSPDKAYVDDLSVISANTAGQGATGHPGGPSAPKGQEAWCLPARVSGPSS